VLRLADADFRQSFTVATHFCRNILISSNLIITEESISREESLQIEVAAQVKQLVKVYKDGTRALDGVDLFVESEIAFSLLEPNGASKTTLIRILTTQLQPTAG
jgi:ABC-type polysaccharide/polyol phosphate transport system ATPase subunit